MADYTISRFYINEKRYYNILEDKDRGLRQTDPLEKIKKVKVKGETAIPTGRYRIDMETVSPKYEKVSWAKKLCGGKMPRLVDVPGFDGILLHPGSTPDHTDGCLLTGQNLEKGKVLHSRDCFIFIYKQLKAAHERGEEIWIEIV